MVIKTQILGQNTLTDPDYQQIAGAATKGAILLRTMLPGYLRATGLKKFIKEWKEKYSEIPGSYAAHGYDAAMVIIEAMKRGGFNPESIKSELLKIKDFDGASGYVNKFTPNGDDLRLKVVTTKPTYRCGAQRICGQVKRFISYYLKMTPQNKILIIRQVT